LHSFISVMRLQRTIQNELVFEGRGLHTGAEVTMRLRPAPRDSGIVFYRSDKDAYINANITSVSDTAFATTLSNGTAKVKTVEHLMAAVSGLGVDNLLVEINGPELPILDGSSQPFVDAILAGGIARQASNRPYMKVTKPVVFKEGDSEIAVFPYDGRMITYQINFDHHLLGHQQLCLELCDNSFMNEVAPARTFGFLKDVEYLKSRGLAMGGSLDNAIILDDNGVLNPTGLRFKDEFIRHKVLDFIGDISLGGFPIFGHFVVNRSGHTTNTRFLKHFLSNPDCWEIVTDLEMSLKATA